MGQQARQLFDVAKGEWLKGVTLVEASAGTGKTYAIAMLVLRAVTELGIPLEEILIVTFTKAATEELRDRVRGRLVQARDLLLRAGFRTEPLDDFQEDYNWSENSFGYADLTADEASGPTAGWTASPISELPDIDCGDATLQRWYLGLVNHSEALLRLKLALADIDRCQVFTIHGFCQRMLAEQALESGQLFDVELLADISSTRMELVEDFWRKRVYSLPESVCAVVLKRIANPEQLWASVRDAAGMGTEIVPEADAVSALLPEIDASVSRLRQWWQENGTALREKFTFAITEKHFKKELIDEGLDWFSELENALSEGDKPLPAQLGSLDPEVLFTKLNGSKLRGAKKDSYLTDWPLPGEQVAELLALYEKLVLSLRVELAHELRRSLSLRLEEGGNLGFDDLISRLDAALRDERQSAKLVQEIGSRYRFALIDEFQDTDACQYRIFSRLFAGGDHYLYLIGDPKQAIYRFRGADIHSYFGAKSQAARILTLDHNFRSHPGLVHEVNRLFSGVGQPFLMDEQLLDYQDVTPAKTEEDLGLLQDGDDLSGMVYCQLFPNPDGAPEGQWTVGASLEQIHAFAVAEILRLLSGKVFLHTGGEPRPLRAGDIAILVRSNGQADDFRAALAAAKLPVVVASRRSVYEIAQCSELILLLQALLTPGDSGRLKAALTIPWFGMSGDDLHALWQDEQRVNDYHQRFVNYSRLWQEQGFLVMMMRLLEREQVFVVIAGLPQAERIIANIHQLVELVEEQEVETQVGGAELVQWLRRRMADGGQSEGAELLLESDEDAVRIVTMHSSKGLEYPVVFCPFLWHSAQRLADEQWQLRCNLKDHTPIVDLGSEEFEQHRELARQEELREDVRLLYVALTRAKLRCYLTWLDLKPSTKVGSSVGSPLGRLLFTGSESAGFNAQQTVLMERARQKHVHYQLITEEGREQLQYEPVINADILVPQPMPSRSLSTVRQVTSFSALAMLSEYEHEPQLSGRGQAPAELHSENDASDQQGGGEPLSILTGLPAGAGFGNVVHEMLERSNFARLGTGDIDEELILRCCRKFGVSLDPKLLATMLEDIVTTPCAGSDSAAHSYYMDDEDFAPGTAPGFCLAELLEKRCLKEMKFYFQLGELDTAELSDVLAGELAVAPLSARQMQGYLTGFVDLICEYRGRYYLIDYKTNFLGELFSDYRQEKLVEAMQSHNYGLQYWIYTLVLHRHLENFLPNYSYAEHFGGVLYLFVRGMTPAIPGNGVYFQLPDENTLDDLAAVFQGA